MTMKRHVLVAFVLLLFPLVGILANSGSPIVRARDDSSGTLASPRVSGGKITGGHADLECVECHADPHKPQIDLTICKTCHTDKWEDLEIGKHKGGFSPFEDYCVTCHDPHHPDWLWDLNEEDSWKLTEDYSGLCLQCHTFSPEESAQKIASLLSSSPHSTTPREVTPFMSPETIINITFAAAAVILFITAMAIWKLPTKPKPIRI
jgi:hypothetical protein